VPIGRITPDVIAKTDLIAENLSPLKIISAPPKSKMAQETGLSSGALAALQKTIAKKYSEIPEPRVHRAPRRSSADSQALESILARK